ncbi:hypothetical protein SRB5_26330 [Streptomyces sp. RB5]|uniref:Uncharacterized protein n=1 Tax=Streptomyces smaragdinus TaxID=2585196 RepID=A0A7K0CG98_9ACTN|nr:hypothetical protein [Streptomyces smaragdinus]MQY12499.1 hypothetical protein [Streptomyces smaragdinus]
MRIKARPGLHYAPVAGGVYFAGARSQFVMRGSDLLFTVADVCVPLLEDGATEDELVAALGSERARPAVRHVAAGLRENGLLLEAERLTAPEPPPDVRERYAESLALLESVGADPYAAFARLRAVTVALAGPPEAVKPAARGLHRAGAGRVVVLDGDGGRDVPAGTDADVVLWCVGADGELPPPAAGDRAVTVVPVLLDDRVLLAGPVVRDAAGLRAWTALRSRALAWAGAGGAAGPPRPVADALAGALAAQLLFETVTDVAGDGEAHVVHGPDLNADRLTVRPPAPAGTGAWRRLADAPPEATPAPDDALELAGALTPRWTGLMEPLPGETLPQMPLALREAEARSGVAGPVAGWGTDQRSATVAAVLTVLRRAAGDGSGGTAGAVGAAGLTEEAWLLDGTLRLLAGHTRPLRTEPADALGPEARRYLRELERLEPGRHTVQLRSVPGVDWLLARVEPADGAAEAAQAWGPDADTAVRYALGTALARAQTRSVTGARDRVPALNTDALSAAPAGTLTALRRQVCAAYPAGHRGRRTGADPVLGELPLWSGPVESAPTTREPADGD